MSAVYGDDGSYATYENNTQVNADAAAYAYYNAASAYGHPTADDKQGTYDRTTRYEQKNIVYDDVIAFRGQEGSEYGDGDESDPEDEGEYGSGEEGIESESEEGSDFEEEEEEEEESECGEAEGSEFEGDYSYRSGEEW